MLEVRDLHVDRGASEVLRGVSLSVATGELVALIGANGAGKTTLLATVSGLLPSRSGEITLEVDGVCRSLVGLAAERITGLGVVHCPEGRQVFATLNVAENLAVGAYGRSDAEAVRADLEQMYALFPILAERRRVSAGSLSGGEQMMLALGRALMARPRLLLLDEPSLGLAPQMVEAIFGTVADIHRAGTSILLVEQNAVLALGMADRAFVLETGRVARSGTGAELAADPSLRHTYLGLGA
jgi:branched-chain amino acid transport system ATP-binding protein